ncbi:ead/Ea22-like family protein [Pseudomonas marginalis]|uniref:ead/Ea22-like family protein n=1 Tax=Pseudomonas marginalis TaxID=298 RepID=UPI0011B3AEDB|nr:ead/Ea22-like family protein [Pseudomonas marginalis]KAA8555144.1 hypothetical protein FX984_01762 [Pseudomonas marginalis]TWR71898.1 hypothetical protein FIV40_09340 [Pseudomonas marginalis]
MTDYTELKRLAEAATPGPWMADNSHHEGSINAEDRHIGMVSMYARRPNDIIQNFSNQAFIAAANPAAILTLIAENARLNDGAHMRAINSLRQDCRDLIAERDRLKAENDQLFGETERLKAEVARSTEREILQLAEIEALRKDAEKWKSVKHAGDQLLADEGGAAIWSACSRVLISVASELNSGRSVVTEEGVTIGDREIGDWRVTVERIDAAMGKGEQS